ncbi:LOB domain-containing protein 25-like [Gastrolobium bilobum]|uniref:LOB domain-containing protein 25-like n=1 Tax=Gastrolobium bilobum TaxID=150636 RepID=UPI002AAFDB42|nr:LOB domain-containing protein 25-like [Gastrolobium bilobum]
MGFHAEAESKTHQPCAACRMLRRRCDSKCLLAPYFPTHEVEKFVGVHRVFGASNVIKMIQIVEETKREDAVKAMVYEATARLRDPVYGSAGAIFQLQKMIQELKAQLESIETRVSEQREQKEQLLSIHNEHAHGHLDTVFPINDNPIFDGYGTLVDFDHPMAGEPLEFPVEGDWVLSNINNIHLLERT